MSNALNNRAKLNIADDHSIGGIILHHDATITYWCHLRKDYIRRARIGVVSLSGWFIEDAKRIAAHLSQNVPTGRNEWTRALTF